MLKSNFTKLFIYSFEKSSNLQALAKESDGYYETIIDKFDNPLYQISSFFNFMALARNTSQNEPYWTKFYKDFEEYGNITTVSYQALSPEGHLVGVVAIDVIFTSGQENLPDNAGNRPTKLNATIFVNTKVTPRINICINCNGKKAICDSPTKIALRYLQCCDNCNPDSDKWNVGKKIAAIGVSLVVVLALFISVAIWWVWRRRKPYEISNPVTTHSWPYE
ncbi:hypothetical protein SUGI_0767290 [Cryptomeria japonica]|nr:hypothetical protein SUGI_0767290 [Cryptomeria japonica]